MAMFSRLAVWAACGLAVATPALAAPPAVTGRWLTQDKDAIIEISPCGAVLCGTIIKFLVRPATGWDATDANNPDPRLKSRNCWARQY